MEIKRSRLTIYKKIDGMRIIIQNSGVHRKRIII